MKSFARDVCMLAAFFALQGVSHADVLTDHPGR